MKIRDRLPLLAVLCCFSALLLLPEVSAQAARDAMLLCAQTLIPSLFPFFVLSSLLIACGASELLSALLSLLMRPLFGLSGAGAAALSVVLYKFRNRGSWLSMLGGMVVGSAVEYAFSWVQELLWGSRSWDYSHLPFNINGRICLLYSFFWGLLGIFWIKKLYPICSKWILKIPNRVGKILTWIILAFFILTRRSRALR